MKTLQTFVCKLSIDFLFAFVTRGLLYGSDGKKTDIPKEMILEREREHHERVRPSLRSSPRLASKDVQDELQEGARVFCFLH